ncbi:MAG: NAD(P)H-dependent oxidoreductase [Zoogloeaceae bacterium]|nr:NAD(P)H-dependent oxidoreductase [Zoogloeaceae bacterium]
MNIALINASPKAGKSNTGILLDALGEHLSQHLPETCAIHHYHLGRKTFSPETVREIADNNVIVLGFPLYFDALPADLMAMLLTLEAYLQAANRNDICVYALINNGFYEGGQNCLAFEIVQNWCDHAKVQFGGGIGQGAGEVIGVMNRFPWSLGFFRKTNRALAVLARDIAARKPAGINYLTPAFPRFLFAFIAKHFFWHPLARKNGVRKPDLLKRAV